LLQKRSPNSLPNPAEWDLGWVLRRRLGRGRGRSRSWLHHDMGLETLLRGTLKVMNSHIM
jgi:hypothetical protein